MTRLETGAAEPAETVVMAPTLGRGRGRRARMGVGAAVPVRGTPVGTVSAMSTELRLPATPHEVRDLARDLAGFTVSAVAERIGDPAVASLERDDPYPAVRAAAGPDQLGLLIRLFLLGGALTPAELAVALPRSGEAARAWGVVREHAGGWRAGIDLRPTDIGSDHFLLAADLGEVATGRPLPPDHVLGLGGASATLVDLTVRAPVGRALDLGTGSGIQTLGLTAHAERVVATDISARALSFAGFTLALNDARAPGRPRGERVALRQGSFFEPVDGEFDLIVSNPPFVVSPRTSALASYSYSYGGAAGDGVVRHLLEEVPRFLRPGGVAQLLANLEVRSV